MNDSRKKQRKEYKQLNDETEYEICNGMRYVKPYIYRHETNCKQVEMAQSTFIVEVVRTHHSGRLLKGIRSLFSGLLQGRDPIR